MYMTQSETLTMWFGIIVGTILGLVITWVIIWTAARAALRDVVKESLLVSHLEVIRQSSKDQTSALALIYEKLSEDGHAADTP